MIKFEIVNLLLTIILIIILLLFSANVIGRMNCLLEEELLNQNYKYV